MKCWKRCKLPWLNDECLNHGVSTDTLVRWSPKLRGLAPWPTAEGWLIEPAWF